MNLLAKKFPTILGILLLVAAIATGWWYVGKNKIVPSTEIKPNKVRITNVADNKFTVSWITTSPTIGEVEFGTVGEKITNKAIDDRDSLSAGSQEYVTHHVTIPGLQPSTQYAFRIVSGASRTRFDNNGSPYTITTGPIIAETPSAESFYGQVEDENKSAATGAIVYVTIPGAATLSTLAKSSGNYSVPLSTSRVEDLKSYALYDPRATVVNVNVEYGKGEATAVVTLANAKPVPTIAFSQNHDFRTVVEDPAIAQVEPVASESAVPTIFNVEPLGDTGDTVGEVVLLNPGEEGEEIATTKPEFRGTGPSSTVLSITVHSATPYSDTIVVANNGSWSWSPPANLEPGEHTVIIAYIDEQGLEQTIERTFTVATVMAVSGDPAFESTPSASVKASASPKASVKPSPSSSSDYETDPSPSPREAMPSTESGVPVTGVMTPTLLTAVLGFAIMVLGALLLAI